ncbi:hypothetical protein KUTeg_013029 [Tegillarca granosa]|uniref:N-acetyltransferase domain-containing protein n=1 Tax=Tegillarca granosa TaxID=220873 RepID=A0ABQ9EWL5_TEGGR|nr:hypothetical protein KUTeg_013029 [Tegillarca granosa]
MIKFRSIDRNSILYDLSSKYGLPFYMQYLAHWPEYFQIAESPSGEIMGYISNKVAVDMYNKLGYAVYRRVIEYYSGDVDEDAFGKVKI